MNIKILNPLILFLLSLLSGTLLFLSFPEYDMRWLAWVALVPLFIAISGKSLIQSFLCAYVYSVVYFAGIFSWILAIDGYNLLHHVAFAIWLLPFFGFFGLAFGLVSRRWGMTAALFAAPFIWVALEFMRSGVSFLSLPWPLLAHSQYQNIAVIQCASFTGTYGVSFLIVLVNAAITAVILRFFPGSERTGLPVTGIPTLKGTISITIVTIALTGLALLYGTIIISKPVDGKLISASVVQGNIQQLKKWDQEYADFIMQTYIDLSMEAAEDRPELIIWPEAATPGYILKNEKRWNQMGSLARQTKAYYIIGSAESPKFQKTDRETDKKYGNSALFISPEGELLNQYLKICLLPFAEYIPCECRIPWPGFIVPKDKKTVIIQGKEHTLFELDGIKFGVSICWENIFSKHIRRFCQEGAQFIVNITNEAWFSKTAAPYQFVSMSVFRAVENGVFVVRCANTGVSCFIDSHGKVYDRVQNNMGEDIFIRGVKTAAIKAHTTHSLYTRYGDWIGLVSTVLFFAFMGFTVIERVLIKCR